MLFVYPENAIQWLSHSYLPAVIGYNGGDYENFYNHPDSETSKIFDIGEETGNTRKLGRWFFRLDGNKVQLSPAQECLQWYKSQPDPPAVLAPCPCTYEQTLIDSTFQILFGSFCANRRFPLFDGSGQSCCYSRPPNGLSILYHSYLLSGTRTGSRYTRYHISDYENYETDDLSPYRNCCIQSAFCHLYEEKRPALTCKGYLRPGRGKTLLLLPCSCLDLHTVGVRSGS